MHALYLAVMLAATGPVVNHEFEMAHSPPAVASAVLTDRLTIPATRVLAFNKFASAKLTLRRSADPSAYTDFLPYGTELNDLYRRYRSDGHWRNGAGITFALGPDKHRWTFTLGPIQFTFGGYRDPRYR